MTVLIGYILHSEFKSKQDHDLTIGKLDGSWRTIEVPGEAEKMDFWLGSWIVQMANIHWRHTPRHAALLVCKGEVLPPWVRLCDIQDFSS